MPTKAGKKRKYTVKPKPAKWFEDKTLLANLRPEVGKKRMNQKINRFKLGLKKRK